MKHLLAGITVLAAAGAILGAAGYYVYKKSKAEEETADYEELIFTDDDAVEYVEVPTEAEEDEFSEIREAIDNAVEE